MIEGAGVLAGFVFNDHLVVGAQVLGEDWSVPKSLRTNNDPHFAFVVFPAPLFF